MAAVYVPDDISIGLQHHMLVDQPRARNGGAARMDRALDAVTARPAHHLRSLITRFDRSQTDFAEESNTRGREIDEVLLDHAFFNHRGTRQHPHATAHARGPHPIKRALCGDRERLHADDVLGASGQVHLARRDHGGDATVHA